MIKALSENVGDSAKPGKEGSASPFVSRSPPHLFSTRLAQPWAQVGREPTWPRQAGPSEPEPQAAARARSSGTPHVPAPQPQQPEKRELCPKPFPAGGQSSLSYHHPSPRQPLSCFFSGQCVPQKHLHRLVLSPPRHLLTSCSALRLRQALATWQRARSSLSPWSFDSVGHRRRDGVTPPGARGQPTPRCPPRCAHPSEAQPWSLSVGRLRPVGGRGGLLSGKRRAGHVAWGRCAPKGGDSTQSQTWTATAGWLALHLVGAG